MTKLKLELESLVMESFETSGDGTSSGTVWGFDSFTATTGGPGFCPEWCSGGSYCGQC